MGFVDYLRWIMGWWSGTTETPVESPECNFDVRLMLETNSSLELQLQTGIDVQLLNESAFDVELDCGGD